MDQTQPDISQKGTSLPIVVPLDIVVHIITQAFQLTNSKQKKEELFGVSLSIHGVVIRSKLYPREV